MQTNNQHDADILQGHGQQADKQHLAQVGSQSQCLNWLPVREPATICLATCLLYCGCWCDYLCTLPAVQHDCVCNIDTPQ